MRLVWFTVGAAAAALAGVYLPGAAWLLPVGLGCWAVGLLLKGLRACAPARRILFGGGLALLWLVGYGALFQAPA